MQNPENRDALIRLVDAALAEQHNEWIEGRRYHFEFAHDGTARGTR